ncbi:MAG: hypothetical protein Ta2A_04330 [Treponemataceae bacterium]|nr:MAG: hypothetical protein Ta2A_04330 [Treponemataceae bacterium]
MAKTITLRLDDKSYGLLKSAADGERRTISNFIEYAAMGYILNDAIVDDAEMAEILEHAPDLNSGLADMENGRYEIIG